MMPSVRIALTLLALLLGSVEAFAWNPLPPHQPQLAGKLVDFTHHHGVDRRFWAPALGQWRDLYVYLPPGFDPAGRYPVMLWLHGIAEDEGTFVRDGLHALDAAIAAGRLPPLIIAMPDGSYRGRPSLLGPRPVYLNSKLGNYEDYIVRDVWDFVNANFPLRPEREAHVIAGFSAGGAGAYRIGLRYPERFGILVGISAPLNVRWVDCHGNHFGDFDPNCWGWRDNVRGQEVVGRFAYGLVKVRLGRLVYPLFGRGPEVQAALMRENPIEMLDQLAVPPGRYQMFVAYGGRDEFNVDAQNESFVYRARERGLQVEVACDPRARHSLAEAERFLPRLICWLANLLEPYRE